MKIKETTYITSKEKKPCCVCGKLTDQIEFCYEAYVCSKECEDVLNKQYMEYLQKTADIEGDFFNAK